MSENFVERVSYEQRIGLLIEWLGTRDPDDWHRVARSYNWDDDLAPLLWILRQDNCERATAQYIFWISQPYDMIDMIDDEKTAYLVEDGYALVKEICERWIIGKYHKSTIAQDLGTDKDNQDGMTGFLDELRAKGRHPIEVPLDICDTLVGRSIDLNEGQFEEGWPEELFDKLWRKQRAWPIETIRKLLGL